MSEAIVHGNLPNTPLGAVQGLPACFVAQADGVYIDPAQLPPGDVLLRELDQMFASGMVLDYACLQTLLFDTDRIKGRPPQKLAERVERFAEERKAWYRPVRVVDGNAEYVFEPLTVEREVDGQRVSERVELDVDEFVASLWQKNVRFGIDIEKVRAAMHSLAGEQVLVACERPPQAGQDGGVEEQTADLHRSNAPRVLADGRADLSQFANRFPQVKEGTPLLKKKAARSGVPGRAIDGRLLLPETPKDFNLAALAGEGTRVELRDGEEFLVAAKDGFLNVDTATNLLSISEKIINRDGVSARTTGNLRLQGDEYEEYGEVQEGRVVEGKFLTFHADVCGRVMSTGGAINIEQNLIGGTALNRDGTITVKGRASGAHLQIGRGVIRVHRAENSVIVGDRIEIEEAVGCTLLGTEIVVQRAEGCAIAGKDVEIALASARGSEETIVSLLRPDLIVFDTQRVEEESYLTECQTLHEKLKKGLEAITSHPDFQLFISTAAKLQRKELVLAEKQEEQWHQFKGRMASTVKRASEARADIKAIAAEIAGSQANLARLREERDAASAGGRCRVASVTGDIRVRLYVVPLDAPLLTRLPPKELHAALRGPVLGEETLFAGDSGAFAWSSDD
ncbi:MAG TPA: FapA family protein [Rhodocyclaceae bacterium]|nr:FapA family protein [Rhodocyclaceae bacterium]